MNHVKNEKGYSLFLTLAILVLFSVLGFSLLALTSSGIKKNIVRQETVQATDLAEKGIDRIVAELNSELSLALSDSGLPRGAFITLLNEKLNKHICINKKTATTGATGKYEVCIEGIEKTYDKNGEENELRKLVSFSSLGTANEANRLLSSKIEIGAETVPEVLKYAIGTNIDRSNGLQQGEGNLLLHGGVHIEGDMKVDGNILTRDKAYAYLGGEKWIGSLYPTVSPTTDTKSAKLVLGNAAYTLTSNTGYNTHINTTEFNSNRNSIYTKHSNVKELFRTGYAPEIIKREPVRSPIRINDQKDEFKFTRSHPGVSVVSGNNRVIQGANYSSGSKKFISHITCSKGSCTHYDTGTFELKGKNVFDKLSTLGNVTIKTKNSDLTAKNLYIEHDLTIGNNSSSYEPDDYANIQLEGTIFVNGNLKIQGANLSSNALIYVNGDVEIRHTTMTGKEIKRNNNNEEGTFIVFANGNIKISNNSVNQEDPSEIKGFFYSEKDLEMFGVGSNIKIEGGLSARRIVLNAIRGRASDRNVDRNFQRINGNSYFESVNGQASRDSRLQIIYDPDIIARYSDLKEEEPIIYTIDPPLERERNSH